MVAQIRVYGFEDELWFKVYVNDIEAIIKMLRSITAYIIKQGSRYQPQIDVIASLILLKCIQISDGKYDRESIADLDPRLTYDNASEMTYELDIESPKLSYVFRYSIIHDSNKITQEDIKREIGNASK